MGMNLQQLAGILNFGQSMGQNAWNTMSGLLALGGNAINYQNSQGLLQQNLFGGQGLDTPFGRIPIGPQGGGLLQQVGDLSSGLGQKYQGLTDQSNQFNENIRQGTWQNYNNLLSGALNTLQGSGDQERRDINTQFNNLSGQVGQDSINRGLTGTTIMPAMQANVERNRSDALGGLNERLLQQKLGIQTGIGGAQIAANAGLGQWQSGEANQMGLTNLGAQQNLGMMPIEWQNYAMNKQLELMGQLNFPYPDPAMNASVMGNAGYARGYQAPSYPSGSSQLWGGLAGGAAAGGGAALGKFLGGCLDANSIVETPDGPKTLLEVEEGEFVRGSDRMFKRIVFKDIGHAHDSRWQDYVAILIGWSDRRRKNARIVLTKDHFVEHKPAEEWKTNQKFGDGIVLSVEKLDRPPTSCADLLLEDRSDYICNGFVVGSMLARYGMSVEDLRAIRDKNAILKGKS